MGDKMKKMLQKLMDRIAPVIPEFQDDLSRLDVLERMYKGEPVTRFNMESNGL